MQLIEARRIVNYVETFGMNYERLAKQLDCTIPAARTAYYNARMAVNDADARSVVRKLNELSARLGMSANDLIAAYA